MKTRVRETINPRYKAPIRPTGGTKVINHNLSPESGDFRSESRADFCWDKLRLILRYLNYGSLSCDDLDDYNWACLTAAKMELCSLSYVSWAEGGQHPTEEETFYVLNQAEGLIGT
jgi:hypothetical protein